MMTSKESHHILREAFASADVSPPSPQALDDSASVAANLPPQMARLVAEGAAAGMSRDIDYSRRQKEAN